MNTLATTFAMICALGSSASALASPWGQPAAGVMTINRIDQYRSSEADREFEQDTLQVYREMGLSDDITLGLKLTYGDQSIQSGPFFDDRSGITDAEIFLQRQMVQRGNHVLAGQVIYIPEVTMTSVRSGQGFGRDAATEFGLHYGLGGERSFTTSSIGYRPSLGDDADQLRAHVGTGYSVGKTELLVDAYGTWSVSEAAPLAADYDLLTLSASAVFEMGPQYRFQLGVRQDVSGRNTDLGSSLFAAIWVIK